MDEQRGLANAPFADHRCAFVCAGEQAIDDLANFVFASIKARWLTDGIAESKRIGTHLPSRLKTPYGVAAHIDDSLGSITISAVIMG